MMNESVLAAMDREMNESEYKRSGSSSGASSANSFRWHSSRLSFSLTTQVDHDVENDSVSEAGDIGDRALRSSMRSDSGRFRFFVDSHVENGVVFPIAEDANGFPSYDQSAIATVSPVTPSIQEIMSPLSTEAIIHAGDKKKESEKEAPWLLEYFSCLVFLAFFGILGVLARYGLQKLFGPGIVGATSDQSYMYLDLPSNMVGSFLMGWFGVVFKKEITEFSDKLAIGLSTGFLGSLTTFSGWNQKMLELSNEGEWGFAVLGILIGLFLVAYSIIFGIETAKGVKWLHKRSRTSLATGVSHHQSSASKGHTGKRHFVLLVVIVILLGGLWCMSGILEKDDFKHGGSRGQLWLACIVGPLGVWIRWFLARLNGRGLGKSGLLRWLPFGTLIANVSAACVMAALATLKKAVNTMTCDTIATGIQFGLLGCLSTVSTFVAEFHAMRQSAYPWRAYAYATTTILISFIFGTLIYSVPVWVKGFD